MGTVDFFENIVDNGSWYENFYETAGYAEYALIVFADG